jgi:Glycosyltransferase family 87
MQTAKSRRVRIGVLVAVLATAVTLPFLIGDFNHAWFLGDFRGGLYNAAYDLLHGRNPYYGDSYVEHLAAMQREGRHPAADFSVPVYPAPAVLATVPFALVPVPLACLLYLFLSIGSIVTALRLLGVRDIKCVAAVFLSIPVLHALILGSIEPLFILAATMAWRWRDRLLRAAVIVASLVATKLFAWPLLLWMLVTRRLRIAAVTALISALGILIAWAIMGFAGLADYPRLLRDLTYLEGAAGISFVAVLHLAGIGATAAQLLSVGLAGLLLAVARAVWRQADGERRAFGLAVMATVIASPIVWPHYIALVFVPIALLSPSFSVLWLVPLIGYAAPQTQTHGQLMAMLPYVLIQGLVIWRLCAPRSRQAAQSPVPAGSAAWQ